MREMLKNRIFKNIISTLLFGAFYFLISFIDKRYVEMDTLLLIMVVYFLTMCLLDFIASKLGRDKERDKNSRL